jgi:hypothetical protein
MSDKNKTGAGTVHGKVLRDCEFRESRHSRLRLGKKMHLCPHFQHLLHDFDVIKRRMCM